MKIGEPIPSIKLPAIDGLQFDNHSLKGKKYLITFFRFATCPFCNMRIAQLKKAKLEMGENFEVIAIFESKIEYLMKHTNKHLATFPILADQKRKYYRLFGVKKSLIGMIKGILLRMPTLLLGILKGYIPLDMSPRILTMPLSLLVDEYGVIQTIYHGKDEGDHIPLEQVISFAKK